MSDQPSLSTPKPAIKRRSSDAPEPNREGKRRQISLYISETEDKLLEQERSRRLARGLSRRGADFASLIRQAIRSAYGTSERR